MQLQALSNSLTQQEEFPMTVSGLIKSTIVLAPDLIELPRLMNNMKNIYSPKFRNAKLSRMEDLAKNSQKANEDSEKMMQYFNEMIDKMKHHFFAKKEVAFENEGDRQACMWLLCTIFCDNLNLPNKKNIFYSGIGFGEFWALTYRMYKKGQISFREAVWLAKNRGTRMSLLTDEYYVLSVREERKADLLALMSKNSDVGILSLKENQYYLYGKKKELEKVANHYRVEMKKSIPFFTQYYSQMMRTYAKRFPFAEEEVDEQLILMKNADTIEQLVKNQACTRFDENALRREIAFYEPYQLKEI